MENNLSQEIGNIFIPNLNLKPNYNFSFHNDSELIGTLDFNGPELVFTGNAEESAKIFINEVIKLFAGRLVDERNSQRDRLNENLLSAVKSAYRKHHLMHTDIGWGELSDILLNALCNAMGDEGFNEWLEKVGRLSENNGPVNPKRPNPSDIPWGV